jgi:hypothetical protein
MSGRGRSLYSVGRSRSGFLAVGASAEVLRELVSWYLHAFPQVLIRKIWITYNLHPLVQLV